MCGSDLPYKPDSKDVVAIIHPFQQSQQLKSRLQQPFSGRLRLSNCHADVTTSDFSPSEANLSNMTNLEEFNVRIHKYGQPLDNCPEPDFDVNLANPIIHSFPSTAYARAMADSKLDLGVGGDGIVGRTISIMDMNRRLLGQGIIGRI